MYERNGGGSPVGSFNDTIQPGDTARYPNAVENMFGLGSTFGAIRVVADDQVVVNSRIFSVPAEGDDVRGLVNPVIGPREGQILGNRGVRLAAIRIGEDTCLRVFVSGKVSDRLMIRTA